MSDFVDIVVPSLGRPSLALLIDDLHRQSLPVETRVVGVDDRPDPFGPLLVPTDCVVLRSFGSGPATARNVGWRATTAPWVAFLDDDVRVLPDWYGRLLDDLRGAGDDVAAVQGRVRVPLALDRPPTDWERNVAGLAQARWVTADMAVRRQALVDVAGFDERFPRAYREDADLALRLLSAGWRLCRGRRTIDHPVPDAPWWISVTKQAGNADDALMDRLHRADWRARVGAPRGAYRRHLGTTLTGAAAVALSASRHRRAGAAAAVAWFAATAAFAWKRIAPGPRTLREATAMVTTSAAIPPAAVAWRLRGAWRARRLAHSLRGPRPDAVLFDRDGTLVVDVPYNGDPAQVALTKGAADAVARARQLGLRVGIVTNQSGVGRGKLTTAQVERVHDRLCELLGGVDAIAVCPHVPEDRCACRKPSPGLVAKVAADLGVDPSRCVVIGDIASDVDAALAAGGRAVLVPNAITRPSEVAALRTRTDGRAIVARDLTAALDRIAELQA